MSEQKLDARVLASERPLTNAERLDRFYRAWHADQLDRLMEAVERLDQLIESPAYPRRRAG